MRVEALSYRTPSARSSVWFARAQPLQMLQTDSTQPRVFALAFDNLVCDSQLACTRIAWQAALQLWPEFEESTSMLSPRDAGVRRAWIHEWSDLQRVGSDGMPAWLSVKMQRLRPAVQSEYETLLLLRLCVDEALASQRSDRGLRPLTAGEVTSSWSQLRQSLLYRCAVDRETLATAYDEASRRWAEHDLEGWAEAHALRPGVVRALRAAARLDRSCTYLLAPRPSRALTLLRHADVNLPPEQVMECSGATAKAAVLCTILQQRQGAQMHYVDSHAETIRAVAGDVRLLPYRLHYAQWGYSTPAQGAIAATMPRVNMLANSSALHQLFTSTSG